MAADVERAVVQPTPMEPGRPHLESVPPETSVQRPKNDMSADTSVTTLFDLEEQMKVDPSETVDSLRFFLNRCEKFPLLTTPQEPILFKAYEKEKIQRAHLYTTSFLRKRLKEAKRGKRDLAGQENMYKTCIALIDEGRFFDKAIVDTTQNPKNKKKHMISPYQFFKDFLHKENVKNKNASRYNVKDLEKYERETDKIKTLYQAIEDLNKIEQGKIDQTIMEKEGNPYAELRKDSEFRKSIPTSNLRRFDHVLAESESVKDLIANCNHRLVVSLARNYKELTTSMTFWDLIQEGQIGLNRAIAKFDYRKGWKFSTYATWWIRQSITRGIVNTDRTVRLPVHVDARRIAATRTQTQFMQEHEREPTEEELVELLEEKFANGSKGEKAKEQAEDIVKLLANGPVNLASWNQILGEDGDGEELGDLRPDPNADTEGDALVNIEHETLRNALTETLTYRERRVIEMRFSEDEEMTLDAVGKELGITRERARQIEQQALEKLSNHEDLKGLWDEREAEKEKPGSNFK